MSNQMYTDDAIVLRIKSGDSVVLNQVYSRFKTNCLGYLRANGANFDDSLDIFQDAVLVFYEKVVDGTYVQSSKIQTYLNSICRFQWLKRCRDNRSEIIQDNFELLHVSNTDWFEEENDETENRINSIINGLKSMNTGNCKKILELYFYESKSMVEIAEYFGYTNADNAKNQKAKCQKRLKEIVNGR